MPTENNYDTVPEGAAPSTSATSETNDNVSNDLGVAPEAVVDETPAETEAPAPADTQAQLDKMEQRYRSLAGVLRSKDEQLQQMQQLMQDMSKQQKAQSAPPEDPLVTDADRSVVGDEVAAFVQRVVDTAVKRTTRTLEERLDQLEASLGQTQQTAGVSAQHSFIERLAKAVPDWEALNTDPMFLSWLDVSPTRKGQFEAAASQFDADAVAVYFTAYKAENGVQAPTSKPKPQKRAQGTRSAPKKTWTRPEIIDFYATGRARLSADEYTRTERDIFDAQREGRVQL